MISAPITRWIEYWAEVKPDHPVLIFEGKTITWRSFDDAVSRWAHVLRAQGIRQGDRVACMMGNRPEFYITFFAVAKLGAVFVPVNLGLTQSEVVYLLKDSGSRALVYESAAEDRLPPTSEGEIVWLDVDNTIPGLLAELAADSAQSSDIPLPDVGFEDLIAILYTSGTTGRPKGAMFTHSSIYFVAESFSRAYDFTQQDIHLVTTPLYFTGALVSMSQPVFLSGGTIVLSGYQSPSHTLELITDHRVTVFLSVPAILNLLAKDASFRPEKLASVRLLGAGAAPVPRKLIEAYDAFGLKLCPGYGLTESGGTSTLLLPHHTDGHADSVGKQTMHTQIRVVRADGSVAGPGEAGEVQQRGPTTTKGYWNNPEATDALYAPGGWMNTGDVGVRDADGFLWIVGRSKDVIIAGGVNVYPAEVESVLTAHPDVLEVAVLGLPHDTYGETVTAVVVPVAGRHLTLNELQEFCQGELAHYKVPRLLRIVSALPRTGSGKVLKNELRDSLIEEHVSTG